MVFISCSFVVTDSSPEITDEEQLEEGKAKIEFTFEANSTSRATEENTAPNRVAFLDMESLYDENDDLSQLSNKPIAFSFQDLVKENVLEVEKGENYRIAFISDSTVEDWKDVTSGLESIPLSNHAQDKIDLEM